MTTSAPGHARPESLDEHADAGREAPARRGAGSLRWSRLRPDRRWVAALPAVAVILALAVLGWNRQWTSDDGYINMRVVLQFWAGNGPVFNPHERVEVTTSTLWLWILLVLNAVNAAGEVIAIQRLAAWVGIGLALAGMILAALGARELGRPPEPSPADADPGAGRASRTHRAGWWLPLGLVVWCALPPMWDFMSSGLETGLTFAWIGACLFVLARRERRRPGRHGRLPSPVDPWGVPLLIGLGPLIRPDLTLMAATFAVVLLIRSTVSVRGWAATAGIAFALPVAWQVFRAGYYATLVPNTALGKGAAGSQWAQGSGYLDDYAGLYLLVVPLAAAAVAVAATWAGRDRARWLIGLAPVVGGLLHALYIVRVGGDFMHGRFLLPATFAMLCSVAVVRVAPPTRARLLRFTAATVALAVTWTWAVAIGTSVRVPYGGALDWRYGIVDERAFWMMPGRATDTSDLATWRQMELYQRGEQLAIDNAAGRSYYRSYYRDIFPATAYAGTSATDGNLGVVGMTAGIDVIVTDNHGLADPFNSRTRLPAPPPGERYRPGHANYPETWRTARYTVATPGEDPDVAAVRQAMQCGDLAELDRAVSAPLTPERFVRNVMLSPRLTLLRIPVSGITAVERFC